MNAASATVAASVFGSATVLLFYAAVRTEWPSNYVSMETDFGIVINRSFLRYFVFSSAPTYLIALVTCTLADRAGGLPVVVAAVVAVTHVARNNGRHLVSVLRHRHDQARYALILVDTFNIGVVVAAAAVGSLGPGAFPNVVPSAADFFSSLWTTAFVAIVGVCLLYVTRHRMTTERLLTRSARETRSFRDEALAIAADENTDPALVLAILYTENLQRPSWIRSLERAKGAVWSDGTYGVMQVQSDRPLDDHTSIQIAVRTRLSGTRVARDEYSYDLDDLQRVLRNYNDNDEFVDVASQLYSYLYSDFADDTASEPIPTPALDPAGRPDANAEVDVDVSEREERIAFAVALRRFAQRFQDDGTVITMATTGDLRTARALVALFAALTPAQLDEDETRLAEAVGAELDQRSDPHHQD